MQALHNIALSWKYALPITMLAVACINAPAALAQATQLNAPYSGGSVSTQDYPGTAQPANSATPTTIPSGFSVNTTDGANTVTYSSSDNSDFTRLDAASGFSAFPTGTKLIETNSGAPNYNPNGPLTITFSKPVTTFGVDVQNYILDQEAFQFSVFDGAVNVGTFTVGDYADPQTGGIDNTTAPGTLAFLGAVYQPGITSILISSSSYVANNIPGNPDSTNDFLVGPLDSTVTPESSGLANMAGGLLAFGGAALALIIRRRVINRA